MGQGRLQRQGLAGHRVPDREFARMQRQPAEQRFLVGTPLVSAFQVRQTQHDVGIAIKRIVKNRRPGRGEMDPQLMGAPGERPALDKGKTGRDRGFPAAARRPGAERAILGSRS